MCVQIRVQDAVQAAAAAEERMIRADNYRATLLANMQLAQARAARDEAGRQRELARSEAELASTIADPYLAEDPAMAASSLSPYRWVLGQTTRLLRDVFLECDDWRQWHVYAGGGCNGTAAEPTRPCLSSSQCIALSTVHSSVMMLWTRLPAERQWTKLLP